MFITLQCNWIVEILILKSCTSILPSSSEKHFHLVFRFPNQPASFSAVKTGSHCSKPPLKRTHEDKEEVNASLAAAKVTRVDFPVAASHIETGWIFHINKRRRTSIEGCPWWRCWELSSKQALARVYLKHGGPLWLTTGWWCASNAPLHQKEASSCSYLAVKIMLGRLLM